MFLLNESDNNSSRNQDLKLLVDSCCRYGSQIGVRNGDVKKSSVPNDAVPPRLQRIKPLVRVRSHPTPLNGCTGSTGMPELQVWRWTRRAPTASSGRRRPSGAVPWRVCSRGLTRQAVLELLRPGTPVWHRDLLRMTTWGSAMRRRERHRIAVLRIPPIISLDISTIRGIRPLQVRTITTSLFYLFAGENRALRGISLR